MFDEPICLTDRLKAVLPALPAARDALNLVELVLDSPTPPAKFAELSLLLKGLCPEPHEREATAPEWRDAASEVAPLCEYTFAGQMLELGLYEQALLVDPRPAWQMSSVSQHLVFAGLPAVYIAAVLPSIDFDRATSNAFDVAHARVVIADRVRSVCIEALDAAHAIRRFAGWSIDDLGFALLAVRSLSATYPQHQVQTARRHSFAAHFGSDLYAAGVCNSANCDAALGSDARSGQVLHDGVSTRRIWPPDGCRAPT